MPFSSSVLMSEASVKRAGGCVKVLRALEVADFQGHACFKLRQVFALFFFYVAALFVEHGVSVKRDVVAACFKNIIACGDDRLRGVQNTVCHLARDKALPNELIQLVLVFCKGRFHVLRCECNRGGANGLVTVLCVGTRLIMRGLEGKYCLPQRSPMNCTASCTASSEMRRESVRMYVMRPTAPMPSMSTPS